LFIILCIDAAGDMQSILTICICPMLLLLLPLLLLLL
jgi:hypothetical protein